MSAENLNLLIVFVCMHIFSVSIPRGLAEVNSLVVIVLTRVLFILWCYINKSVLSYLSSIVSLNFIQFVGIFPADIYDRLTAYAISGKKEKKPSIRSLSVIVSFFVAFAILFWFRNTDFIRWYYTCEMWPQSKSDSHTFIVIHNFFGFCVHSFVFNFAMNAYPRHLLFSLLLLRVPCACAL